MVLFLWEVSYMLYNLLFFLILFMIAFIVFTFFNKRKLKNNKKKIAESNYIIKRFKLDFYITCKIFMANVNCFCFVVCYDLFIL